jgi:hypothetical protein
VRKLLKWRLVMPGFWRAGIYSVEKLPDGGWAWKRALGDWNSAPNVHAAKGAAERHARATTPLLKE